MLCGHSTQTQSNLHAHRAVQQTQKEESRDERGEKAKKKKKHTHTHKKQFPIEIIHPIIANARVTEPLLVHWCLLEIDRREREEKLEEHTHTHSVAVLTLGLQLGKNDVLQLHLIGGETADTFGQLEVGHLVLVHAPAECLFVQIQMSAHILRYLVCEQLLRN
jgi:sRNA-binding protein